MECGGTRNVSATDGQPETKASVKRSLLLDSSGWVAAAVHGQTGHAAAKAAYTFAVRDGMRIVVTPMVLGESHALFLRLLGRAHAHAALDSVLRDPPSTLTHSLRVRRCPRDRAVDQPRVRS